MPVQWTGIMCPAHQQKVPAERGCHSQRLEGGDENTKEKGADQLSYVRNAGMTMPGPLDDDA